MTIEELSSISNVPLETIRNLIYNKAKNPRIDTVLALSKSLRIPVETLLSDNMPSDLEVSLLNYFRHCSSHGKQVLLSIAALEYDLTYRSQSNSCENHIPCFNPYLSPSETSSFSTCDYVPIVCRNPEASMAIRIQNNEFAPFYYSDDIVLLISRYPRENEHVIFYYNGKIYFRRFSFSGRNSYAFYAITGNSPALILKNFQSINLLGTAADIIREPCE